MAPQQHTRALYYTNDTIDEILIDPRGDASHVTAPHPSANGNQQTLKFKIRYHNSFTNPQEEAPVTRWQPARVLGSDQTYFSQSAEQEILAVVSERGEIFRNTLVADQDVDYDFVREHAKNYFSKSRIREDVA